ncbi:hypothetical protein crov157 [Cafeteria roenbergensis virus]|uniref:Uncharacterized protein n=1 Tax=Cafeteria roenbergensis virus (strain BV-PW1) TaxID=693272 RepID=E3T4S7_CROVB|nr:hypothetical protein crov157 [Cafeteria roenbergensis virus BV-PW1]ADO67190.1 hypothetical protein crov157 [Cafeteria roenbergensis virus BV-PW1]
MWITPHQHNCSPMQTRISENSFSGTCTPFSAAGAVAAVSGAGAAVSGATVSGAGAATTGSVSSTCGGIVHPEKVIHHSKTYAELVEDELFSRRTDGKVVTRDVAVKMTKNQLVDSLITTIDLVIVSYLQLSAADVAWKDAKQAYTDIDREYREAVHSGYVADTMCGYYDYEPFIDQPPNVASHAAHCAAIIELKLAQLEIAETACSTSLDKKDEANLFYLQVSNSLSTLLEMLASKMGCSYTALVTPTWVVHDKHSSAVARALSTLGSVHGKDESKIERDLYKKVCALSDSDLLQELINTIDYVKVFALEDVDTAHALSKMCVELSNANDNVSEKQQTLNTATQQLACVLDKYTLGDHGEPPHIVNLEKKVSQTKVKWAQDCLEEAHTLVREQKAKMDSIVSSLSTTHSSVIHADLYLHMLLDTLVTR